MHAATRNGIFARTCPVSTSISCQWILRSISPLSSRSSSSNRRATPLAFHRAPELVVWAEPANAAAGNFSSENSRREKVPPVSNPAAGGGASDAVPSFRPSRLPNCRSTLVPESRTEVQSRMIRKKQRTYLEPPNADPFPPVGFSSPGMPVHHWSGSKWEFFRRGRLALPPLCRAFPFQMAAPMHQRPPKHGAASIFVWTLGSPSFFLSFPFPPYAR